MKLIIALLSISFFFASPVALAKRGRGHAARVKHGAKKGLLTKEERGQIKQHKSEHKEKMKQMRDDAKSDGDVSKEERKAIREARKAGKKAKSKMIHDLKHNDVKKGE